MSSFVMPFFSETKPPTQALYFPLCFPSEQPHKADCPVECVPSPSTLTRTIRSIHTLKPVNTCLSGARSLFCTRLKGSLRRCDVRSADDFDEAEYREATRSLNRTTLDLVKVI
jgi:hypothetical protein